LYHDLEGGLNPIAFFFPNLPIPAHKKRDIARIEIQKLFNRVINERRAVPVDQQPDDMLNVFMNAVYRNGETLNDEHITGLLIGLLFAGQHTSGITATWTGLYLHKHRNFLKECIDEQNEVRKKYGEAITYELLRPENTPRLESCVREALRMHPPLIFLMRKVMKQLKYKNYEIPVGDLLCISPAVAMRLPSVFTNPDTYDPHRFDRGEDKARPFSFLAFGGGKHGCPGERFGILQVKTIWCVLLRTFEFDLVGDVPPPDYTNLVVGPLQPASIKYKRIADTVL
jgi:sterol 14-demethylase